ncbi:interleukin-26 [Antennarius striatus]|uniref:interleukin-26 n=1 Tax=Antennarius striatus TaxID=241820 RepID=UPI0035B0678B
MFLLLLLTAALSPLTGGVAPGERGITCRQEIPPGLIRELWSHTTQLINRLPKREKVSRRLLPKFCTRCPERLIGWLEMKEVLNVYQRTVFSATVIQKLLPLHFSELLFRLQHTLQHCESSSRHSRWFQIFRKLERKIKKRRQRVLKAVREFTFILRWLDELAEHHSI